MAQHFLLSKAARTLSLAQVARLSDDAAWGVFKAIRWADTEGAPFCPRCGCLKHSFIATRKLFKCGGCRHQYSVTSGTIFASRKLPIRDHLLTDLMVSGKLFADVGLPEMSVETDRFMLCGSPDMIRDTRALLADRGYSEGNHGEAGHYVIEKAFVEK